MHLELTVVSLRERLLLSVSFPATSSLGSLGLEFTGRPRSCAIYRCHLLQMQTQKHRESDRGPCLRSNKLGLNIERKNLITRN